MNLLTQEQGSQLKPGDVVNMYTFTPRKPKNVPEPPSRQFEGRTEWVDYMWENQVVVSDPFLTASDGWGVKRQGCPMLWLTRNMEKVDTSTKSV